MVCCVLFPSFIIESFDDTVFCKTEFGRKNNNELKPGVTYIMLWSIPLGSVTRNPLASLFFCNASHICEGTRHSSLLLYKEKVFASLRKTIHWFRREAGIDPHCCSTGYMISGSLVLNWSLRNLEDLQHHRNPFKG